MKSGSLGYNQTPLSRAGPRPGTAAASAIPAAGKPEAAAVNSVASSGPSPFTRDLPETLTSQSRCSCAHHA